MRVQPQPRPQPGPRKRPVATIARCAAALPLALLLSGCDWVVLNPAGDIARQQAHLVVLSTALMLLIIVPVMVLTALFAWRYRATNTAAVYDPEWHHSTKLELVIWSAPLAIIIALGSVTWVSTHMLDPYRPLSRIDEGHPLAADVKPLEVDVVALDWKWLFIYPEQKVATVNELVLPTGRPVTFRITSSTVMNSFYVPALAGQIYAMPGMQTQLHAVLNQPGTYKGFSANFSGAGFASMHFVTRGVDGAGFDSWVDGLHKEKGTLDRATYLALEKPSQAVPVIHYASVDQDLFGAVLNLCVRPGKMCTSDMAAIDAKGGAGKAGMLNVGALTYDKDGRETETSVLPGSNQPLADASVRRFVKAYCAQNQPLRAAAKASTTASATPLAAPGQLVPGRQTPPSNVLGFAAPSKLHLS